MLNRWPQQLAQTLVSGQLTPVLTAHLDPLLLWLSHPDHPQVATLALALERAGLTRPTAARQAYLLLDQLLFSGLAQAPTTLGVAPHTAPALVKQRYRRLLQVYHPDRHATRPLWATQRTERINLAFQAHRRGTHGWTSPASTAPSPVAAPALRAWHWRSLRLPRRWKIIGLGLATTSVVLISSVLLLTATTPPRPPPLNMPLIVTAPPEVPVIAPPAAPPIIAAAEPEPAPPPPAVIAPPAALAPAENVAAPVSTAPALPAPPAELPPHAAEESPPAAPAVTIPTPIPPTAPAQPEFTAPLAAATVAPPPPPTLTTTALDCRVVPAQLQQFQHAYNAGAVEQLMTLYSPAARENDLANWESIRQTYTDWFRTTSQRQIQFTKLHIKQTGHHCAAVALYQVRYHTAQQQPTSQTGIIEFLFEQRGVAMQILRVRY
ncbi:hypothetical protein CKO12_10540 [Chromatium okenii]|uniref:J domain-containing protein n=1 Tax=Chromatium okenii TaxID=61644 RepID=UPI001902C2AB|nr:J domain-containing protein [Chromatium okenii]MBK1642309.1 hypothetical protein [Chromatium okenii]